MIPREIINGIILISFRIWNYSKQIVNVGNYKLNICIINVLNNINYNYIFNIMTFLKFVYEVCLKYPVNVISTGGTSGLINVGE